MEPQIRLQAQHKADLALISELGSETVQRLTQHLNSLPQEPVSPGKLQEAIAAALGPASGSASEPILRQLLALHGVLRNLNINPNQIFGALRLALDPSESGWTHEQFEAWKGVEREVKNLFNSEIIYLSAKALDLSYEHAELLQRARILTDIRPVFSDDATQLRGTVISHTLIVRYDDPQGDHVLSLSIDEDDIQLLMKQCERAMLKSRTAQSELQAKAKIPTIIPGRQGNNE